MEETVLKKTKATKKEKLEETTRTIKLLHNKSERKLITIVFTFNISCRFSCEVGIWKCRRSNGKEPPKEIH